MVCITDTCGLREFKDTTGVCSNCADYTYPSADGTSCVFDTCSDVQKLKEVGTCEDCQPFNRADETGKVCRPDTCDDSVQILIENGMCSTCQTFTHPDDDNRNCISDACTATQILIYDGTCIPLNQQEELQKKINQAPFFDEDIPVNDVYSIDNA